MKQIFSFLLAGLLIFMSCLTAGCSISESNNRKNQPGPASQKEDFGQPKEQAMGRYREETIAFPVPARSIFDIEKEGNTVRILLEQKPGNFCCCKSQDAGATWQQESWDTSWLPEHYRVVSACFAPENTIFVSFGKISEDPLDEQHATGAYEYIRLKETPKGLQTEPFSPELPKPREEYLKAGYGLRNMVCSEDGTLTGILQLGSGETQTSQIMNFNSDNGVINWKRDTGNAELKLRENILYLNEYDGTIKILDFANGSDLSETVLPSGTRFLNLMDSEPENQKFYYCNETGIYSSDHTMSLTELLVDGNLSSFSDITSTLRYFCQMDETIFLVFLETTDSDGLKLLRYEYDPDLPTQPEHELKIYSLYSNYNLQRLVSDFHSTHPNVLVTYEAGMESSGAKSESDAISILNTEIMAGKGPDVLFLNGLPWNSYARQDILLDLNSLAFMQENQVIQNLFTSFEKEGRQYAVPVCFSIPILAGEESRISQVDSLEDLLEMVRETNALPPLEAENFLPYTFSIFWQNIQKEDGSISEEEVKKLLQCSKELNDLLAPEDQDPWAPFLSVRPEEEGLPAYDPSWSNVNVWNILYGNTAASTGYLGSVKDFTAISDHIPGQAPGWKTFPAHVFTSLLAGINGKSPQTDLAGEFLEFILSEEEQMRFIDGSLPVFPAFPVHEKVWQTMAAEPAPEKLEEYAQIFQKMGGTFHWPSSEEFDRLEQQISELDTPAMEDALVLAAITEKGRMYLSGGRSLEETVNEIIQTLELYLAESGISE